MRVIVVHTELGRTGSQGTGAREDVEHADLSTLKIINEENHETIKHEPYEGILEKYHSSKNLLYC